MMLVKTEFDESFHEGCRIYAAGNAAREVKPMTQEFFDNGPAVEPEWLN